MDSVLFYPERVRTVKRRIGARDIGGLVDALVEIAQLNRGHWSHHDGRRVADCLIDEPADLREAVAGELLDRSGLPANADAGGSLRSLASIITRGLGTRVSDHATDTFLAEVAQQATCLNSDYLAHAVERRLSAGRELPGEVVAVVRRTVLVEWMQGSLHELADKLTEPPVNPGERWSDQVLAELPALGAGWRELLAHAGTATAAKPSVTWARRGRALLEAIGPETAQRYLADWLALVGQPRTVPLQGSYGPDVNAIFDPYNATLIRGMIWLLGLLRPDPRSARVLGGVVETALRKVPGLGPRSPKIANAAVYALSTMDGEATLAQIARLAARVTFKGTLKELNGALDRRAAALNLTRDEVEELAVPAYGLTEVGRRVDRLGEATAEVEILAGQARLTWRNTAGRTVKSPPAAVRTEHADELKELKAAVKDIDKMLSAQVERLDRQFLARRTWRYAAWRERYLDHPLVGTIGRRLLWLIDGQPHGYAGGALRTVDDAPAEPADDATVELWHPIGRDVAEVMSWRDWLERHQITQPFKQAHREVYLLTAAEETTRTYSNRYAAHVLRQHQFHSLAAVRGWRNKLRLLVDDSYPPANRELPQWGLRAEFWIEGIGEDGGTDTTDAGSFLRVATDQVRFYPADAAENTAHASGGAYQQWPHGGGGRLADPLPLDQVPPLVFSEVMRDVDLFVGVASVGNDPTWQDGGPDGRFQRYWQDYSFGELSATARTRAELLARLVPRLAIADRCTIDGRFLVVRGDLRTYKIHLGSGNILMSPNDQYLCIVPKPSTDAGVGDVFLPFEGDRTLAVILSKAMLLAKDTGITDPTIVRQIGRSA